MFVHASVGADGIEADALLGGPKACSVMTIITLVVVE